MTVSFKLFALFLSTSIIAGCNVAKVPDVKVPDVKLDADTEKLLSSMYTCDKKDSELDLSRFDQRDALIVRDKIESKQLVFVDCKGNKTAFGMAPTRKLNQFITVEAPSELKEKVNFVQIENSRTCSVQKVDAKDDSLLEEQIIEVSGQDPIKLPGPTSTALGISGKMKILLSDDTMKFASLYLNVHDNNNTLKISYYGKCLKYRDVKNEKLGESYNCLEADLLGETQMLVSVKIERPEVAGTVERNTCTK
ncbi:hypothetical protein [Bdellovibrio svalbardensis]|uniref:Lipoprotein n=1 Tax=Bdellovibrio svalbardensis TaxID=2972972 RepID=A0ABT6DIZ8_9BACT|nr:hypothetical protein [Bdellovibrio svalbardensis]MDG0816482.1 hypothetical protein [Bdellovibrio svalbardensis]